MQLHVREYGVYSERRPSLILLHGLLGSSTNWHGIARQLAVDFHLLVPDLRNHGRSPHASGTGYPDMLADVLELLDEHGLESVIVVGHSMGGKLAMWMALEQPQRVAGLVVADIAPVHYSHSFDAIFGALRSIPLATLRNRAHADRVLTAELDSVGLRQYLLQNLVREAGRWHWRMNLDALQTGMEEILTFPATAAQTAYSGPTLFVYGTESDYVGADQYSRIRALFPHARLRPLPGAGHWLYAEQPERFLAALIAFFEKH